MICKKTNDKIANYWMVFGKGILFWNDEPLLIFSWSYFSIETIKQILKVLNQHLVLHTKQQKQIKTENVP